MFVVIRSWRDRDAEELFRTGRSRRWSAIESVLARKLDMLDAAAALMDLASPPGNMLEALLGDRAGQHSIRVNRRWRVCFVWTEAGAEQVEVVDYH